MPIDQMDKVFQQLAQARRIGGMAQRHGLVHEVKEGGGERKVRLVLGFHNGKPWLSPWMNTEEHRGGSSSQQHVEKGQAMVMTCHGGDYRNATCSPSSESKANPQPPHAPQFTGDTTSNGSKVRTATNRPGQQQSGGTSLLGTAEVLTPDGFKNIQELKLGDKVWSFQTGYEGSKPVEDTIIGLHSALTKKPVLNLSYEGGCLRCTGDHTIWVETRNNYIASDSLGFLDKLRGFEGTIGIVSVQPYEPGVREVFDLTVETNGNFYARDGSTGVPILVHNAGGGGGGGSDTHSIWIDNQKEQRAQHSQQTNQYSSGGGGGQSGGQGQQGQSNKPDPLVITHLNDDGSWTARHGSENRMMVLNKGSKMKTKQAHAIVTKDGKHIVKQPWIIGKDPFPDNDSV